MATPPDSQLLWVNKDVKSYRHSRKVSTTEASVINTHSQQRSKAARTIASQRALRESSAAKTLVGWKSWGAPQVSSDSISKDGASDSETPYHTKDGKDMPKTLDLVLRRKSSASPTKLVPHICGKDEGMDPFRCTSVKMDSNMYELFKYYLARLHPAAFNTKPRSTRDTPDVEYIDHVSMLLADEARFFSLIACTAVYKGSLDEEDQKGQAAIYLGRALVVLREQIRHNAFVRKESLYTLVNMAICAEFLGDCPATLAHIRAAKFVIDREGGFSSQDVPIVRQIIRADLCLAVETLSCPVLTCLWKPTTVPLPNKLDPQLEQEASNALVRAAQLALPANLHEYVCQIVECTRMLYNVWSCPNDSETAIRQLGSSLTALLYHLLSLSFESYSATRKTLEATRVSLVIWTWMLSQALLEDSRSSKDHVITFDEASLDSKRHILPSRVYLLLKEWNRTVQSSEYKGHIPEAGSSMRLVRIVQAMERETEVELGSLMERLFEIEKWYWLPAKPFIHGEEQPNQGQAVSVALPRDKINLSCVSADQFIRQGFIAELTKTAEPLS